MNSNNYYPYKLQDVSKSFNTCAIYFGNIYEHRCRVKI